MVQLKIAFLDEEEAYLERLKGIWFVKRKCFLKFGRFRMWIYLQRRNGRGLCLMQLF